MRLRTVYTPWFRDPREAVLYAIRLLAGRGRDVRVKTLHPRLYLVTVDRVSFVVVVRETMHGWCVKPIERSVGEHEERVM